MQNQQPRLESETRLAAVVEFAKDMAGTSGSTFLSRAPDQLVTFQAIRDYVAMKGGVTVNVYATIHPSTLPADIVDKNGVLSPADTARAPAPRTKPSAQGDTEAKHDGSADKESRTWRRVDDQRIV